MPKEFIEKNNSWRKGQSNERGKCPVLPDFAHITRNFPQDFYADISYMRPYAWYGLINML